MDYSIEVIHDFIQSLLTAAREEERKRNEKIVYKMGNDIQSLVDQIKKLEKALKEQKRLDV